MPLLQCVLQEITVPGYENVNWHLRYPASQLLSLPTVLTFQHFALYMHCTVCYARIFCTDPGT
jgi:hypothetical protein